MDDLPLKSTPDLLPFGDLCGLPVSAEARTTYMRDSPAVQGTILWPVSSSEVLIMDDGGKVHRVGMDRLTFLFPGDLLARIANAREKP